MLGAFHVSRRQRTFLLQPALFLDELLRNIYSSLDVLPLKSLMISLGHWLTLYGSVLVRDVWTFLSTHHIMPPLGLDYDIRLLSREWGDRLPFALID